MRRTSNERNTCVTKECRSEVVTEVNHEKCCVKKKWPEMRCAVINEKRAH